VALYVGLAMILLIVTRNSTHRGVFVLAACLLCVVPLIVATSRVYRGMHFATDVMAGALAGGLWMVIVVRTLLSHQAVIGDTTRRRP
jgi:membrane-associated phospholipid phosphatase